LPVINQLFSILTNLAHHSGSLNVEYSFIENLVNRMNKEQVDEFIGLVHDAFSHNYSIEQSIKSSNALCDWINANVFDALAVMTLDELIDEGKAIPVGVSANGQLVIALHS
jgi:hypothetical protein